MQTAQGGGSDYWTGYQHAYNDNYVDKRKAYAGAITGSTILVGAIITFLLVR